ncbi:hypothetical protein OF83DRAFT_55187, partial [Amylostereum chailletii]
MSSFASGAQEGNSGQDLGSAQDLSAVLDALYVSDEVRRGPSDSEPPTEAEKHTTTLHDQSDLCVRSHDSAEQENTDDNGTVSDNDELHLRRQAASFEASSDDSASLQALGDSLVVHYQENGDFEDVNDTIRILTDCYNAGLLVEWDGLSTLGSAHLEQYKHLGLVECIEDGIFFYSEALKLCPSSDDRQFRSLEWLGLALQRLYKKTGKINDLERAIVYCEEALNLHPQGHPQRSSSLSNLA